MFSPRHLLAATSLIGLCAAGVASAAELNLYSSRHYDTDQQLYDDFTEETGITINLIEASGDELIERIKAEGANSPADVLITVDAGRLWRADQEGLFQPTESAVLDERIPAEFHHPDGHWFGFSTRARVIYYNTETFDPSGVSSYEDLASDAVAGELCIRTGSNIYNLSLLASIIEHAGEEAAREWAAGVVENFARPPEGNDTAQIRAVAAGECGVSLGNHYYLARLIASDDPADQEVVEKIGVIFPNQDGRGTHVNISGAGVVATAPNPEAAVQFLEYLASDSAQDYFSNGNNEFPTAVDGEVSNPTLKEMGALDFARDDVSVAVFGEHQAQAQIIMDEVGWK